MRRWGWSMLSKVSLRGVTFEGISSAKVSSSGVEWSRDLLSVGEREEAVATDRDNAGVESRKGSEGERGRVIGAFVDTGAEEDGGSSSSPR